MGVVITLVKPILQSVSLFLSASYNVLIVWSGANQIGVLGLISHGSTSVYYQMIIIDVAFTSTEITVLYALWSKTLLSLFCSSK